MSEGYSKSSLLKSEAPSRTFPFRQVPLGQEGAGFVNIHPLYQVRNPKFKKGTGASDRRSIRGGWAVGSIAWVPTLFLSQADTYMDMLFSDEERRIVRHTMAAWERKNLNWTRCNSKWAIPYATTSMRIMRAVGAMWGISETSSWGRARESLLGPGIWTKPSIYSRKEREAYRVSRKVNRTDEKTREKMFPLDQSVGKSVGQFLN